jgi:hypothetical protein
VYKDSGAPGEGPGCVHGAPSERPGTVCGVRKEHSGSALGAHSQALGASQGAWCSQKGREHHPKTVRSVLLVFGSAVLGLGAGGALNNTGFMFKG